MIRNGLPDYLKRKLGDDGLISARWVGADQLRLRVRAQLPRVRPAGERECAGLAWVMITFAGEKLTFRLELPEPAKVMHPNWDARGYWRDAKAQDFACRSERELAELLRYMIGGLNFRPGCYSLDAPVNRSAASWCRRNGHLPDSAPAGSDEELLTMHARELIWRTGRLGTVVKFPENCPLCKSGRSRISEIERESQWWWSCAACGNRWDPVRKA